MTTHPMDDAEAREKAARLIAEWACVNYDDLQESRASERPSGPYPQWATNGIGHTRYQGGKLDLLDLVDKIAAALPRCSCPALVEALERLIKTSQLLLQNSEGCAVNHYGVDFEQQGMPGWLADCQKDIEAARAALAAQLEAGRPQLKRVRHKKRGTFYHVLGPSTLQTDKPLDDNAPLVIYRSEVGGRLRARAEAEFYDGRYEDADDAESLAAQRAKEG